MAVGYVLRSPHAHARIRSIDTAAANAATDAAFARAAHVVKHGLVINRVTAASMEPRGSIGVYQPYDGRYTIYTTLQRTFPFREELAKTVLRVSENKVRVIAGDIG